MDYLVNNWKTPRSIQKEKGGGNSFGSTVGFFQAPDASSEAAWPYSQDCVLTLGFFVVKSRKKVPVCSEINGNLISSAC